MQIYGAKTEALINQVESQAWTKEAIEQYRKELVARQQLRSRWIATGSWFAAVCAILCILFGFLTRPCEYRYYKAAILAVWLLIVPLWFALETFYLYDPERDASLEILKQGQEVASKAWIAVSVVLAALYFGKDGLHL